MVIKANRSGGTKYPSGYTNLHDHGLIGNMRTAALVSISGTVSQLCLPHFDSPTVFARILDKDKGGHFSIASKTETQSKQQYSPSTNILCTKFLSDDGVGQLVDYMPIPDPSGDVGHLPWLIRKVEVVRGELEFHVECAPAFDYARATHKTTICPPAGASGATTPSSASASLNPVVLFECPEHIDLDLRYVRSPSKSASAVNLTIGPPNSDLLVWDYLDLSARGHKGLGVTCDFKLKEGESVTFVLREPPKPKTSGVEVEEVPADECFTTRECDAHSSLTASTSQADPVLSYRFTEQLHRETHDFWVEWVSRSTYTGLHASMMLRSALTLKLLTFSPTGAIVAAPSFSLPEDLTSNSDGRQSGRNWDYRYSWLRDSSFSMYALIRLGFKKEADQYVAWLSTLLANREADGSLQIMYTIWGGKDIEEVELPELDGHKGQKPVRIGNGAATHLQLDIYGELLDAIYLAQKFSKALSYDVWVGVRSLVDYVAANWRQPDLSIWEVRGARQNFLYSKIMLWVALDRGLRLADKRSLPAPNRNNWIEQRDLIYEEVMTRGWNAEKQVFCMSYETRDDAVLDSSVLIMPLCFFISASDPRFLSTLRAILRPKAQGGLTENSLVYRYDTSKIDDGTGGGEEGSFSMVTLFAIEALSRTGDKKMISEAMAMLEDYLGYGNHLGLFSEEISKGGEALGNFPQAFSHTSLISTVYNLDRATR